METTNNIVKIHNLFAKVKRSRANEFRSTLNIGEKDVGHISFHIDTQDGNGYVSFQMTKKDVADMIDELQRLVANRL
jgi:hypothetical protein